MFVFVGGLQKEKYIKRKKGLQFNREIAKLL